jgi:hypothetical protein
LSMACSAFSSRRSGIARYCASKAEAGARGVEVHRPREQQRVHAVMRRRVEGKLRRSSSGMRESIAQQAKPCRKRRLVTRQNSRKAPRRRCSAIAYSAPARRAAPAAARCRPSAAGDAGTSA